MYNIKEKRKTKLGEGKFKKSGITHDFLYLGFFINRLCMGD